MGHAEVGADKLRELFSIGHFSTQSLHMGRTGENNKPAYQRLGRRVEHLHDAHDENDDDNNDCNVTLKTTTGFGPPRNFLQVLDILINSWSRTCI